MDKGNLANLLGIRLSTLQDLTWDLRLLGLRLLNRVSPRRRQRLKRLNSLSGVYLHVGSGPRLFPGWINIDAYPHPGLDIDLDLRFPLPLLDRSCRFIFAEHLLEHFGPEDGALLCREFYRLLEPGGICRIIVPDAEKYWRAYRARDLEWFKTMEVGAETPLGGVNNIYYGHFHRWMYDFETLSQVLAKAGFERVNRSGPLASNYPQLRWERTDPARRDSSLYVEGIKSQNFDE